MLSTTNFWQALAVLRYLRRSLLQGSKPNIGDTPPVDISSVEVRVINLAHRKDRREQMKKSLSGVGLRNYRFLDAEWNSNGHLGCAISHHRALEEATASGTDFVVVAEDDCEFFAPPNEVRNLLLEFLQNPATDVLCLIHYTKGPTTRVSRKLAITTTSQTTALYIAKARILPRLKEVFYQSIVDLEAGKSPKISAIDMAWKELQKKELVFVIPTGLMGRQKPSKSDITGKWEAYPY